MTFKVGIIVIPTLQVRYLGLRNTKQLIQGYTTSNNQNISNSALAPGLLTTAGPYRWLPPGPAWTLLQSDGDHGLAIILITSTGTPEDGERAGLLWKRPKPARGGPRPTVAPDRFPSDAVRLKHQDPLWPAAVTVHAPAVLGETVKAHRPCTLSYTETHSSWKEETGDFLLVCVSPDMIYCSRSGRETRQAVRVWDKILTSFLAEAVEKTHLLGSRFRLTLTLTCPYSLLVPFISNFLQSKWWEKKWAILLTDEETEVSPEKRGLLRKRGEEEAGKAGRRWLTPLGKGSWEG